MRFIKWRDTQIVEGFAFLFSLPKWKTIASIRIKYSLDTGILIKIGVSFDEKVWKGNGLIPFRVAANRVALGKSFLCIGQACLQDRNYWLLVKMPCELILSLIYPLAEHKSNFKERKWPQYVLAQIFWEMRKLTTWHNLIPDSNNYH